MNSVGEQWLDAPRDEDPRRTPRGIIHLERRRQPNGGQFHPIDPDCPCCQALAEMPGIGFWHMDGCNMDDLFAFAYYHETIESWERDQADYRELSEQIDQELSWDVQPNVTRLLAVLDKLTTHLERYLSESEEDESASDSEPDFSPQPPRGFRWRKVLRVSKELRHVLQSFTDIAEETPNDGWYADDVPF